jgi:hypothetical protein
MGDRFYAQQAKHNPKRRLTKDIVADVENVLTFPVSGLDRMTCESLENLLIAITARRTMDKNREALQELADA